MSQQLVFEADYKSTAEARELKVKLDSILQEVSSCVSPVWPLKDYVAVNPYFGLADRSFMSARNFLRVFSECELLMPLSYFAEQRRCGHLTTADIEQALSETAWPTTVPQLTAADMLQCLEDVDHAGSAAPANGRDKRTDSIRCIVDHGSAVSPINWHEIVTDEISKLCSAHYDDGQASWGNAWRGESLYSAWREIAQVDRNAELLGLTGMRKLVASLPAEPKAAIVELLCRLNVPYPLWSSVLLSQIFSMPGWFAWAKYQDQQQADDSNAQHLIGLLAIRLAYDYAVGKTLDLRINWTSYIRNGHASFQCENTERLKLAWVRYVLLKATEIHFRQDLLSKLPAQVMSKALAPKAQMVFCIDVRSERMRRHIETLSHSIETYGFAGFFGLPIEFLPFGESQPTAQLPVLLKPQHCVHECVAGPESCNHEHALQLRTEVRWWRKLWQSFKTSSIGSFAFVESSGLLASWQLISKSLGIHTAMNPHRDGLGAQADRLRPNVNAEDETSLSLVEQTELAARVLSNLGLTKNFARLVVFCGHFSQTSNNPLAAGLDCGACGGHGGAPNARWLALVLNRTEVRLGLCERGIMIPADTHFLAAAHNTTTDAIEFFDLSDLPASHRRDVEELRSTCLAASASVAVERAPQLCARGHRDIAQRAADWSEVRPEWGLAGNAAIVVGPRSMTSGIDLNGQVFLHSYEEARDPSGAILETIMTAPMIVANWINMQYYASTVDNHHFGSGSKTIHNVVGRFGILSGNSGDLQTGLPLQSLHDGTDYRHRPLRLLVLICASRASIERIYQKHELVANLINNEWLSLVAIDGGQHYRLCASGQWQQLFAA